MSIKPIDMQVMIPNSTKISHEKQGEQDKNVALNQNVAHQIKDKYEHEVEYVHEKDKADQARIQKKQPEEDGNASHDDKNDHKDSDEEDKEDEKSKNTKRNAQVLGTKFDIKV